MRFATPGLLALLWLLVPALLLFVFKRRPRRVRVSTLPFFKSLAQVYQESPWLRRLKKLLAVLFAALTLGGIVFGLSRLIASPAEGSWRGVVIVVDGSASMTAAASTKDDIGATRIARARETILRRVSALGAGTSILLMRYDRRPEILLPHSLDRREFRRALESLDARPVEGEAERALVLAARLASMVRPAKIIHVSDTAFLPPADSEEAETAPSLKDENAKEGSSKEDGDKKDGDRENGAVASTNEDPLRSRLGLADDVEIQQIVVGSSEQTNIGITAFSMRPLPLEHGHFEAFVEVRGTSGQATDATESTDESGSARNTNSIPCTLEVRLDRELVELRELSIPHNGPVRLLIPIEGQAGKTVQFQVQTKAPTIDAMSADNTVVAPLPPRDPLHVVWVRSDPDPFTQIALQSLMTGGEVQGFEISPDAWPYEGKPVDKDIDVILFDGWVPKTWPEGVPAIVLRPPSSVGPVDAAPLRGDGLPVDRLRAINQDHPLLYGVASERVAVTQTSVLQGDGPMTPLWLGPNGPLLVAGDVRGQRVVVMGFSAERSESLPFTPAYPLLLGNAILWCCQSDDDPTRTTIQHTGDVIELSKEDLDVGALTWTHSGPRGTFRESSTPLRGTFTELDRVGVWRVGERQGGAALLSHVETLSTASQARHSPDRADTAEASSWLQGDLRPHLLWLLLVLLVGEAWLFHRWSMF